MNILKFSQDKTVVELFPGIISGTSLSLKNDLVWTMNYRATLQIAHVKRAVFSDSDTQGNLSH